MRRIFLALALCLVPIFAIAQSPVYGATGGVIASLDLTAQAANISSQTLFTPTATGTYLINYYSVVTQPATTSSTFPAGQLQWTDPDTNAQVIASAISFSGSGNLVGSNSVAAGANTRVFRAKAGAAVLISNTGYATVGATPMQYAVHVTVTRVN